LLTHASFRNYKDEKDVAAVHGKFEELNFPYDVLWLDIEHTDGKRYFTWDKSLFPDPKSMQESLWREGRRMVTIVDPHLKRDPGYYIHSEATEKGLYVKNKDGSDYDGWCWPGPDCVLSFDHWTVLSPRLLDSFVQEAAHTLISLLNTSDSGGQSNLRWTSTKAAH
jgi:alpha-glucosidase (family GH31 glycosyl hydrolase)